MKISRREKIILGLTVLALIYAGGVFFFPDSNSTAPRLESDGDLAQGIVSDVVQSLALHHRTETEQVVLEKAQVPWPPAPFIAAAVPASSERKPAGETTTEVDPDAFIYTGYIEIGSRRLAIINGEEYETGDRITGAPYTVRGIAPEQVLLGDIADRIRAIPMADDSAL